MFDRFYKVSDVLKIGTLVVAGILLLPISLILILKELRPWNQLPWWSKVLVPVLTVVSLVMWATAARITWASLLVE